MCVAPCWISRQLSCHVTHSNALLWTVDCLRDWLTNGQNSDSFHIKEKYFILLLFNSQEIERFNDKFESINTPLIMKYTNNVAIDLHGIFSYWGSQWLLATFWLLTFFRIFCAQQKKLMWLGEDENDDRIVFLGELKLIS